MKHAVTPTPNILKAITHNPLKPIDALCELIDNSIDDFITFTDNPEANRSYIDIKVDNNIIIIITTYTFDQSRIYTARISTGVKKVEE